MSDWINYQEEDDIPRIREKVLMMVTDKNEKFNIFIGFIDEEGKLNVYNTLDGYEGLYWNAEKLSDDNKLIFWMPLPEEPVRKYSYRFQRKMKFPNGVKNVEFELIAELPYDLSCGKCPMVGRTGSLCELNYTFISEEDFHKIGRPDHCGLKPVDRDIEW